MLFFYGVTRIRSLRHIIAINDMREICMIRNLIPFLTGWVFKCFRWNSDIIHIVNDTNLFCFIWNLVCTLYLPLHNLEQWKEDLPFIIIFKESIFLSKSSNFLKVIHSHCISSNTQLSIDSIVDYLHCKNHSLSIE